MKVRVVTANVDFTLRPAKVREDLERILPHADIICFQEAKRVDLDRLIRDNDWEVWQPMANDATRGSAVAWRKSVATLKAKGRRVGTYPHGRAMLTRHIVWARLRVQGRNLVVVSAHLPPKRYWGLLYGIMLRSLATFVAGRRGAVLIGADWNKIVTKAPDLTNFARRFKAQRRGVHIDGFILAGRGRWRFASPARILFETNSDHRPVKVSVRKVLTKR